jgi:hypothetical protein
LEFPVQTLKPPLFFDSSNPECAKLRDRYCDECGVYIDTPDLWLLAEGHGVCWRAYRRSGKTYPMPANVGLHYSGANYI